MIYHSEIFTKMEDKIQQLQILEQNLQTILMQKQAFQMELSETEMSLNELKNSKDEFFKVIGQIMIKSNREKLQKEFEEKIKLMNLRIETLDKQEESFSNQLQKIRDEILEKKKK